MVNGYILVMPVSSLHPLVKQTLAKALLIYDRRPRVQEPHGFHVVVN